MRVHGACMCHAYVHVCVCVAHVCVMCMCVERTGARSRCPEMRLHVKMYVCVYMLMYVYCVI